MSENEHGPSAVLARGARESLIESFGITGLYGYRSIALSSDHAATILIAKNGTGKTTLLGALNAFLRLQFSRLRNLEFDEIHCKLRSHNKELVLSHNDVIDFLQLPIDSDFSKVANRIAIEPSKLFNYISDEWSLGNPLERNTDIETDVFRAILKTNNYNYQESRSTCDRLRKALFERQPNITKIYDVITSTLADYEIVYLPTYRRVELALTDEGRDAPYRRRRQPRFNVGAGSLFTGDIQFGLSDISDRLVELNQQIIVASNDGYGDISANIIDELIEGAFEERSQTGRDIPTEDELKLFFSRVEQVRRVGPYIPVKTPHIEKIYSDNAIPESSRKFLTYFLEKLFTIIKATKDVESPVDSFIENCNKYLLSSDLSTSLNEEDESVRSSVDGKALRLNRRDLKVYVESVPPGRRISLDALSSGEKQMISLFAKLYLYPKNKIVLIDEPELSLSIDWQMQILVDVLNAPLCRQIIAITHSPFVFDNDLEPFAKSLAVTVGPFSGSQTPFMDDEDEVDD